MKRVLLAIAVIALSTSASGQTRGKRPAPGRGQPVPVKQAVIDLERQWFDAIKGRDAAALDAAVETFRADPQLAWSISEPTLEDVFIDLMSRSQDNFR